MVYLVAKNDLIVLQIIKENPCTASYDLAPKLRIHRTSMYQLLKKLGKMGLIDYEIVGKTRAGYPRKSYSLSVKGYELLSALSKTLDEIISQPRQKEIAKQKYVF